MIRFLIGLVIGLVIGLTNPELADYILEKISDWLIWLSEVINEPEESLTREL